MNRVIKFRAWDVEQKKMVSPVWVNHHSVSPDAHTFVVDDLLIPMQFTGLTDKNGKEIYEGDVITSPSVGNLKQGSVEWGTCGFVVREQGVHGSKDGTWTEVLSSWAYPLDGQGALRGEIIGNIYENPELLEKGDSKGGRV